MDDVLEKLNDGITALLAQASKEQLRIAYIVIGKIVNPKKS